MPEWSPARTSTQSTTLASFDSQESCSESSPNVIKYSQLWLVLEKLQDSTLSFQGVELDGAILLGLI